MLKVYITFELMCILVDLILMNKFIKFYRNRKSYNSLVSISIS